MKIKKYGKNKTAFKKLVADESTKITMKGKDAKSQFEFLIGYEFLSKLTTKGLEITGIDGETFLVVTPIEIEVI